MDTDYSGVATWELANVIHQSGMLYGDIACELALRDVRGRNPRSWERDIHRIVYNEHGWTCIRVADLVCLAVGKHLAFSGLTIIPSSYTQSAQRMAEDEFWAKDVLPTVAELALRVSELKLLRDIMLTEGKCLLAVGDDALFPTAS